MHPYARLLTEQERGYAEVLLNRIQECLANGEWPSDGEEQTMSKSLSEGHATPASQ